MIRLWRYFFPKRHYKPFPERKIDGTGNSN